MAPLVLEMKREKGCDVEVEILPGISAFQKGAALLGAPIGHDFCIISLSDLMTPWEKIERRIEAAAALLPLFIILKAKDATGSCTD